MPAKGWTRVKCALLPTSAIMSRMAVYSKRADDNKST
jgi:hypothetical protein